MSDTRDLLERVGERFPFPADPFERLDRRRIRRQRNRRVAAGVVGVAVALAVAVGGATLLRSSGRSAPADPGRSVSEAPDVDYVIDLNTGEMTPLPGSIIASLGGSVLSGHYAVSPDGSRLAYTGLGDDGMPQIFIAEIDGSRVRQMTFASRGATSPAWSPDGTKIAYEGSDDSPGGNGLLFVLDVATRDSTAVDLGPMHGELRNSVGDLQFTSDGSSLLYSSLDYTNLEPAVSVVKTIPLDGGKDTILFGLGHGDMEHAHNGSMSPDGSLVTFLDGNPAQRWVANAEGSELRQLATGCASSPPGTWSPDESQIVCWDAHHVLVVDVATGNISTVVDGDGAIWLAVWLDDHTLLIEV